jgi:hypothetical protein
LPELPRLPKIAEIEKPKPFAADCADGEKAKASPRRRGDTEKSEGLPELPRLPKIAEIEKPKPFAADCADGEKAKVSPRRHGDTERIAGIADIARNRKSKTLNHKGHPFDSFWSRSGQAAEHKGDWVIREKHQ